LLDDALGQSANLQITSPNPKSKEGGGMGHRETPHQPDVKEMSIEEKWDRLHDFFTMDHAISY
jgi:hypothetical protein